MYSSISMNYKREKISVSATFENFNDVELDKINKATSLMADCLNSKEFEEFVKNYSWKKTITSGRFWWKSTYIKSGYGFRLSDMMNIDVYRSIINASEVLNGEIDNEVDVSVVLDKRRNRRVLGYTYANTSKQWIYNFFFRNGSVADIAGNVVHEWTHKLGFGHEYKFNSLREFTVPYAIGYFVRDWIRENS